MHLVDDAQVLRIVQQAAFGRDLGVDPAPERDVRLELGGPDEMLALGAATRRRPRQQARSELSNSSTSRRCSVFMNTAIEREDQGAQDYVKPWRLHSGAVRRLRQLRP